MFPELDIFGADVASGAPANRDRGAAQKRANACSNVRRPRMRCPQLGAFLGRHEMYAQGRATILSGGASAIPPDLGAKSPYLFSPRCRGDVPQAMYVKTPMVEGRRGYTLLRSHPRSNGAAGSAISCIYVCTYTGEEVPLLGCRVQQLLRGEVQYGQEAPPPCPTRDLTPNPHGRCRGC